MKQNKKTFIAMLSTSTFLGAVGQIFFKLGVTNGALPLIIAFLFIGLFAYFVSSLIYIYVLTRTQLSWGVRVRRPGLRVRQPDRLPVFRGAGAPDSAVGGHSGNSHRHSAYRTELNIIR